jgi:dTDP-glucose pyrophosphorylase
LVRDVVSTINQFGLGTVFVTGSNGTLRATVTDGDVRRALLAGHGLDSPAETAFNTNFLALEEGADSAHIAAQGAIKGFREYPVVDSDGRLVCVEVLGNRRESIARDNTVVIMAGGKGLRLRPLTEETPKPLLRVGGKPILQHIIDNLRDEGFSDIVLAINYLGEQIESYFQDGSRFGVNIRYVKEDQALGTAGALSLLQEPISSPIVVMNGDLVLAASVGKMVDYHLDKHATITVGAKVVETTIPFGVLSTQGLVIDGIEEKPTHRDLVNAGVYILNSEVFASLSDDQVADMPELILENVGGRKVLVFPMHETWADLGRPADLSRANDLMGGA